MCMFTLLTIYIIVALCFSDKSVYKQHYEVNF